MRVDAFDFDLPEARIALRPARPRDAARLLVIGPEQGVLQDASVSALADWLVPGDVLVFNDTKVIPARLSGTRSRGDVVAKIEITLHQRLSPNEWLAFAKPAKRLAPGDRVQFSEALSAEVMGREGGEVHFQFSQTGAMLDAAIAAVGVMPLPPYIASKRATDEADAADYQTYFAREPGAVAAPTAGLHFTQSLLDSLEAKGIGFAKVTLHVGAGTFLPMSVDDTDDHKMHSEVGSVSEATADMLNTTRKKGGRIIAVGTTSLRLLESATTETGEVQPWSGATDIFITPGYRFRAIDVLMTNFHLPKSTLFMLVSAFRSLGEMQNAYAHAIQAEYRFYSYGDACLIFPEKDAS
ncbi:MAG: tRNA preQ1(34) S-adenosylmethionine ribosyltransferase-isomerase QueA [Rhodobiaceae bacterium]|nr:MAG: tRNA preQ1(34) S-adenosylmethionine ribosyltransferase-isomerase QueA [Rhodobiaceae bacterium]